MQLFFSIWEFRSQQASSSTENTYLVKTSVIIYVYATCFGAWVKTQEEEVWEISGRALHRANKERFSCAFWLFWKYRKAMYWRRMSEMMWSSNGMIYRALWESHECHTWDLSIPEVEPSLCDENKIVPTGFAKLYAFLILAHKSRKWNCSSWRALASEFRL